MHLTNASVLVTGSFPAPWGACFKLCCILCVEQWASFVCYDFPQSTDVSEQQHVSAPLIWECDSVGLILMLGHRVLMSFFFLMFDLILIKCSTDFQELEEGCLYVLADMRDFLRQANKVWSVPQLTWETQHREERLGSSTDVLCWYCLEWGPTLPHWRIPPVSMISS